jgi:non-ribosomal peptide synthetase component F
LTSIPTDRQRIGKPDYMGREVAWRVPGSTHFDSLAGAEAATVFMVLSAALAISLAKWSGQNDVAIGTLYGNRDHPDLQAMIGFFANLVILRIQVEPSMTFRGLLRKVRQVTLSAFAHSSAPFDEVMAACAPDVSADDPVSGVLLVVHNQPVAVRTAGELSVQPHDLPTWTSRYELCLAATPTDHGIDGIAEYATELFDSPTVRRLVTVWLSVVDEAIRNPDKFVSELWELEGFRPT